MTTTGGRGDLDLTAPVVEHADGDDIVVIPDAPHPSSRGRVRAIVVGAIIVVLVAAGVTIGAVGRSHSKSRQLNVAQVGTHTKIAHPKPAAKKPPAKVHAKPRVSTPTAAGAVTPTSVASVSVPPVTPTAPPPTTPPVESTSVLTWTSTPASLTIKSGAHATFTVTVTNPTAGTVTLGQPLSCPPALQTQSGTPLSSGVCVAMAQVMSPHQTLTQQYTVTAMNDTTGKTLAPGNYVARVENLYSIPVTVTAG